ncbi:MAG: hypothetical protein CL940_12125 [Deltaproteobacteria bacterium]|nr:hypothetical protein [Deltaproteobacteria bacterium]
MACGSDDGGAEASICEPGATQACVCPGADGAQSCSADGSGWEACVCGDEPDAAGGEDGATTSDGSVVSEDSVGSDGAQATCDYTGGWPCNPNKDEMVDPGVEGPCPGGPGCACSASGPSSSIAPSEECDSDACVVASGRCLPAIGALPPRFTSLDQFGEEVDLYDFAGHGVPVVINVSAGWAVPGQYEKWLLGQSGFLSGGENIRDAVLNGELRWITLLIQDADQMPVDAGELASWSVDYPIEGVPVLADNERQLVDHYAQGSQVFGLPSLLVFDGDLGLLFNGTVSGSHLEFLDSMF